jgi:signal transduction histidine kinase
VNGVHLEVLSSWDVFDHHVVEVALPLTAVDSVLHGLLISYALLAAAGVLLAILLGALISSSALAPINRFLHRTEDVTSDLDKPKRLEETGPPELRRLAVSFNQTLDALEHSIESQRHLVADASHELRTPIAALRSNIQIFLEVANVIDNARKWSPPDGLIEVRLRDGVLSVRDHGPGFQEKDLPYVFDRFYRADNARRLPGAGLGLAIVKQAAETHGGRARADNAPDGGGVVTVSFSEV